MKKNNTTTLFDNLLENFFDMFNEFNETYFKETKQSKDKCHEVCHHGVCDCEHCNDENKDDIVDKYKPNFKVLRYTDEDFKDKKKLEDYIDELSNLAVVFESMPEVQQAIIKALFNNTDIVEYIDNLIDHAGYVYNASIIERNKQKCNEEAEKNQDTFSSQTKELASRYVDEVFIPIINKSGSKMSKSQISSLKTSFTNFANWILKQ